MAMEQVPGQYRSTPDTETASCADLNIEGGRVDGLSEDSISCLALWASSISRITGEHASGIVALRFIQLHSEF